MTTPTYYAYSKATMDGYIQALQNSIGLKLDAAKVNVSGGVAGLDGSTKVALSQSPVSVTDNGDGTYTINQTGKSGISGYNKTQIDTLINNEISARGTAVSGVSSSLATEVTNRTSADTNLQNQINQLGGSSGFSFTSLGWIKPNLTATTQAGATANSNAVAIANSTALQSSHDSAKAGTPIYIPPVSADDNLAYFFASTVYWSRDDVPLLGSGATSQGDISSASTGGSTFKDIPGFSGPAIIARDGTVDHANVANMRFIANTAMAAVLDNSTASTYLDCSFYGGTQAAYDCRAGNVTPYNVTQFTNPSGAKRINMVNCIAIGTASDPGVYCIYFGTDFVITGGRYTTGTKCFVGSGAVCTGVHFTGGAPLIDVQGIRNTCTSSQFDGCKGIAMFRVNGGVFIVGDSLFYQSTSSANMSGGTAIPVFLIQTTGGPRVSNCHFSSNGDNMPFTYLTQYSSSNNSNSVGSTIMDNITGATTALVATLWDSNGAPLKYSVSTDIGVMVSSELRVVNKLSEIAAAGSATQAAARANLGISSGSTSSRPTAASVGAGAMYFDTTTKKPVWSTGTGWVDATGAAS